MLHYGLGDSCIRIVDESWMVSPVNCQRGHPESKMDSVGGSRGSKRLAYGATTGSGLMARSP